MNSSLSQENKLGGLGRFFTVPEVIHIIIQALTAKPDMSVLALGHRVYISGMLSLGSLGDTLQKFLKNKYAEIDFKNIPTNQYLM